MLKPDKLAGDARRIMMWVLMLAAFTAPVLAQTAPSTTHPATTSPATTEPASASATGAASHEVAPSSALAIDALLMILKDDKARAELIARLEAIQKETTSTTATNAAGASVNTAPSASTLTTTPAPTTPATDTTPAAAASTPTQSAPPPASEQLPQDNPLYWASDVSTYTVDAARQFYSGLTGFWRDLSSLPAAYAALATDKMSRLVFGAPALALTVLLTILAHWVLRRLLSRLVFRGPAADDPHSTLKAIGLLLLAVMRDVVTLAGAYILGYLASVLLFGDTALATEQGFFFEAFLVTGSVRIGLAILVHPGRNRLPVFNLPRQIADELYMRLRVLFGLLIYGITAAVPISNYWTNLATGRVLRVVVITVGAAFAIMLIRRIARLARESAALTSGSEIPETENELEMAAEPDHEDTEHALSGAQFWLAVWPWLAYLYVASSWALAIAQPALMADIVGTATLGTLIVGASVVVLWRALDALVEHGIPLPRRVHKSLPPLKQRIDGFLPLLARTLSVFVLLTALFFLLDAWGVIDGTAVFADAQFRDVVGRGISAFLIVSGALFAWAIVASFIDHRLNLNLPGRNVTARSRTLMALFRNAFTVLLLIFAGMSALSQIGLDVAPLLAGAGVAGLAIGFGAQKLVQDIITGIFIQVENAINVGDVVTVAGISGVVEKLTIRSVGVRDLNGVYHIVPFSAVDTVSNFMRKFAYHVAEIGVAYKENIANVKDAMQVAFEHLKETEHGAFIMGDLEMHGVTALADSSVMVRARIKTKPGQQWAVGRAYTEMVKQVFDERGIEIPFPHRTMVYRPEEIEQIPTPPRRKPRAKSTGAAKT